MARGNRPAKGGHGVGLILALLGLAGLFGAVVVALMQLIGSTSAALTSAAVYCAGVLAMIVITGAAQLRPAPLWALRLGTPLAGAALVLALMLAFGA